MAQWVNLNRNNGFVIVHRYSALSEKAGLVLLPLVGLTAGWLADEMRVDFEILKFSTGQTICIFASFSIFIIVLSVHFNWFFSTKTQLVLRCVLRCIIIWSLFFPYQSLLLSTIVLNDIILLVQL